jgi:ABC-type dipeptide/oligopeptide/nickel transport system ATPase component
MDSDSGALAIIGKAGCGKSVLAKTIQEGVPHHWNRLSQSSNNHDLLLSDWFYCRRMGDVFMAYSSLLRNVLYQLLDQRPSLFHHYKLLHRRNLSSSSQEWTTEDLQQIMKNINMSGLSILMIFDAIDEAEDDRMVSFIETLVSRPGSSIKAILLSRPLDAFERRFWEGRRVTLQDENNQDINLVVQHGLLKLRSIMNGRHQDTESEISANRGYTTEGPIKFKTHAALRQTPFPSPRPAAAPFASRQLENSQGLDVLGKNIRERAEGVILWVVLVFDSIYKFVKREPLTTIEDLMSCVAELPPDIDALYSQMVKDLADTMSDHALGNARQALMWIDTVSQLRAFTLGELWDAMAASSLELNDSGSGPSIRGFIDRRIEIQSWKDFNRILRRLCGSLIEILPPKSAISTGGSGSYTDVGSRAISGECVVQLMHQTVKDFLTSSPAAGAFSFTEAFAQNEALRGCQNFIRSTLPDDIDSIISLPRDRPQDWVFFSADMARYLEELRLFPLCLQMFNSFPESMRVLQTQLDMKWYGLLPRWLHDVHPFDLVQGRKYDPAELTLTASALGLMFQFISRRGLRDAARNLLSILDMGSTAEFWPRYRDVVLNALVFTVFDLEGNRASRALRVKLLTPMGDNYSIRRESANLALASRYHETTTCDDLINDQESAARVPDEDAVKTIELILDYKGGTPWGFIERYWQLCSSPEGQNFTVYDSVHQHISFN